MIAQPLLSPVFGGLAKDILKQQCDSHEMKVRFIHNIHFGATVPDCTYVGRMGARIKGPISDYHSRIVLNGFLAGLPESDCLAQLSGGNGFDLQAVWEVSVQEIRAREENVDITFAEELFDHVRTRNSFHYFNHPRPEMLEAYAGKILTELLETPVSAMNSGVPDLLAIHGSWPVYGWVASGLGLPYSSGAFAADFNKGSMSLAEFIAASYRIYRGSPEDNLV